jgi:methylated-DNA-protein-cysteine methyltransferase related protein
MQKSHYAAIYFALSTIPSGRVIAYGQLAKLAGLTNGARQVGRVLCNLPEESTLAWHRVVNAQGEISLPQDSPAYREQQQRLIAEGIEIKNGKINLSIYGYNSRT